MKKLIDFMAEACHYAQEHCGDTEAWSQNIADRTELLQCVSYQMACFLSQNTVNNLAGWSIILEEITSTDRNKDGYMVKSIKEWKTILNEIAKELGGWSKKIQVKKLVDFMAEACHYAQEHCGDTETYLDETDRTELLQCVSYQMACFLSQNTVNGKEGVEWDVVLDDITSTEKNEDGYMVKSIKEWKTILNEIAKELGGWI